MTDTNKVYYNGSKTLEPTYRNMRMVPKVIFGSGSFNCLEALLLDIKQLASHSVVFLVDDVFKEKPLKDRLPNKESDLVLWISAEYEPKTDQVDQRVETLRMKCPGGIAGVVGIGGGTLLDLAKAVSVMFNNSGYSSDYQGWDLVEHKGLYHIGIPTLSGTGSEISRTAVLSGPERKLGINSDFVVFDQVILDPELTAGVP
jgi:3-deoxy-alpha-D-manno-octulosonate 8-oxidase